MPYEPILRRPKEPIDPAFMEASTFKTPPKKGWFQSSNNTQKKANLNKS